VPKDDFGSGAHGAALSEVAAEGSALVVGHRQVEVAAVLRQGAGERDDLEWAVPGGVLGAAGEAQPNSPCVPCGTPGSGENGLVAR
jgi:hypothetical protein